MRRSSSRQLISAVAVSLLAAACGNEEPGPDQETRHSALQLREETVDNVWDDDAARARAQVADIVDIDGDHFAIGYVHAPEQNLRYAYYGTTTGQEMAPTDSGTVLRWLRANTSRSLAWNGDCGGRVNFFSIDLGGTVFMDAHSRCGGTWNALNWIQIAESAMKPSVATKGDLDTGKALVVYGQAGKLMGRIYNFNGTANMDASRLDDAFMIVDLGGNNVFSTDIIYNQHSDSFIVGYTDAATGKIYNVVLSASTTPPAIVKAPRRWGGTNIFDGGSGHYTSVAYNPLGNGYYIWWRQDEKTTKQVYVHDKWGVAAPFFTYLPTAAQVNWLHPSCGPTNLTVPLSPTASASTPQYVALKDCPVLSGHNARLLGRNSSGGWDSLDDEGSWEARQAAVRALDNETAGLLIGTGSGGGTTQSLVLVVSDQP